VGARCTYALHIDERPFFVDRPDSVFLRGLPSDSNEHAVEALFKDCGAVKCVKIIEPKPNMHAQTCMATVTFENEASARRAQKKTGMIVKTCAVQVLPSRRKEQIGNSNSAASNTGASDQRKAHMAKMMAKRPDNCRTIYVGGLPDHTTEQGMRAAFSKYEILWRCVSCAKGQAMHSEGFVSWNSMRRRRPLAQYPRIGSLSLGVL